MVMSIISAVSIVYFFPIGWMTQINVYYNTGAYDDCEDNYKKSHSDYDWRDIDNACSPDNNNTDGWRVQVRHQQIATSESACIADQLAFHA